MDPNLFHLDWERVSEVLAAIIVLSFVVERALALLFEHRLFVKYLDRSGLKEVIAFIVSAGICLKWNFDAISMIVLSDHTGRFGAVLTGALIAGGSKASIKLFHDVLNVRSSAHEIAHPKDPKTGNPEPQTTPQARASV